MDSLAVAFLCIVGVIYSLFLLGDCYASWKGESNAGSSVSPKRQQKCSPKTSRKDWWCQAIAGVAFLGIAAILLARTWQDFQLIADGYRGCQVTPSSVQVPGMSAIPARTVLRDSVRPGHPIWGANLGFLAVTDADVRALVKEGTEIEFLILNGTDVTDESIPPLRRLPYLITLALGATQVTDSGCEDLAKIVMLEQLDLFDTEITDRGLASLQHMPRLTSLNLDGTEITDSGCQKLTQIETLEELSLSDTSITNAGLEHLSRSTSLRQLTLTNTAVGDAGLKSLQSLDRLEYLVVLSTNVTDRGVQDLKKKNPHLTCVW